VGLDLRWIAALRDLQIQLEPRVSRSEVRCSKRLVRTVPGSARNWIAVNAVQQTGCHVIAPSQPTSDAKRSAAGQSSAPAPPAISFQMGGGAIRGIGEKFSANPVTGTGAISVPMATSPGRSGFGPQLSLSYDLGSGTDRLAVGIAAGRSAPSPAPASMLTWKESTTAFANSDASQTTHPHRRC